MATILIVEDSPTSREYLVTTLEHAGHRLHQAKDGSEALAVAQAEHPDLIICDILMPTMDGYEFVRRLRCEPVNEKTPVIFCAANYHERDAQTLAKTCGVQHVMTEPCPPDVLLRIVNQHLGLALPMPLVATEVFDHEQRRLLTDKLANKVGELEAVTGKLTSLLQVKQDLALELDATRLAQRYCEATREIVGARYAAVGMLATDSRSFQLFCVCGEGKGTGPPPADAAIFQAILKERRAVREPNIDEECVAGLPLGHTRQRSFLGAPITSAGELYGILYVVGKLGEMPFSDIDEQLATTLAAQLGSAYRIVLQYGQLKQSNQLLAQEVTQRKCVEEQLQKSTAQLRVLSRRLMDAQESERRAIAQELHDEIGQALTILRLNLHVLQGPCGVEEKASCISDSVGLVERTLQQVRDLSLNLRPSILDDLGLIPALEWQLNKLAARAGFHGRLNTAGFQGRLPAELETTCFRVVQEALTNVVRHAQARRVTVTVGQRNQSLVFTVRDDGVGFDVEAAATRARDGDSMGLLGMQERVLLCGGELSVRSAPGRGTEIWFSIPLADALVSADSKQRSAAS